MEKICTVNFYNHVNLASESEKKDFVVKLSLSTK